MSQPYLDTKRTPTLTDWSNLILQWCAVEHFEREALDRLLKQVFPQIKMIALQRGFVDWWELVSELTVHLSKPGGTYRTLALWTPEKSSFTTWISKVTWNLAGGLKKKEGKRQQATVKLSGRKDSSASGSSAGNASSDFNPAVIKEMVQLGEDALNRADMHLLVQTLMEQLDPKSRELLQLFFFEGLSLKEIAELWGVSYGALRKRKSRLMSGPVKEAFEKLR